MYLSNRINFITDHSGCFIPGHSFLFTEQKKYFAGAAVEGLLHQRLALHHIVTNEEGGACRRKAGRQARRSGQGGLRLHRELHLSEAEARGGRDGERLHRGPGKDLHSPTPEGTVAVFEFGGLSV